MAPARLMEVVMKLSIRILTATGALVAAGLTPLAQADTGSDWFDAEVAQVQQRVSMRNQLEDDLVQSQLALGYSVPEALAPQSKTMLARADDNAFDRAMGNLHRTMVMYAMAY
jgi:hypothetical protein